MEGNEVYIIEQFVIEFDNHPRFPFAISSNLDEIEDNYVNFDLNNAIQMRDWLNKCIDQYNNLHNGKN